jgi:hypothetical protein
MDILIQTFASSVYKAREMYAIDHPLANFDNYQLCANQGIQYRTGNSNTTNEINVSQVSEQLQVEIVGKTEFFNYRIFNSLGQLVHQWNNSSKQQNLDASNILQNSGIYILQAQTTQGTHFTKKFVYTK